MTNRAKWLLATLAVTGMAGAVYAQSTPASGSTPASQAANPGPDGDHWHHDDGRDSGDHDGWRRDHWRHHGYRHHHHRFHGMNGMMVHVLHQLNLTDAQKQSVHKILADARSQMQAQRNNATPPNFAALANPGDPKHAAALQDLQMRIAARIKAQDQIHQQIYGVLTPDQKTQLASLLATKQAQRLAHSEAG